MHIQAEAKGHVETASAETRASEADSKANVETVRLVEGLPTEELIRQIHYFRRKGEVGCEGARYACEVRAEARPRRGRKMLGSLASWRSERYALSRRRRECGRGNVRRGLVERTERGRVATEAAAVLRALAETLTPGGNAVWRGVAEKLCARFADFAWHRSG